MTENIFENAPAEAEVEEPKRVLPTLPLVFTGRDGTAKQIGTVELQLDGTIKGTVYRGAEGALPALFSMPLAFAVDGTTHYEQDLDADGEH